MQFWKLYQDVTSIVTDSWQEGSLRDEHIQERLNKEQREDTCRRWRRRGRRRRRKTNSTSSTLLTGEICRAGWSESGGELTRPITGRSQTLCLFSGDEIKLLPALLFFSFCRHSPFLPSLIVLALRLYKLRHRHDKLCQCLVFQSLSLRAVNLRWRTFLSFSFLFLSLSFFTLLCALICVSYETDSDLLFSFSFLHFVFFGWKWKVILLWYLHFFPQSCNNMVTLMLYLL